MSVYNTGLGVVFAQNEGFEEMSSGVGDAKVVALGLGVCQEEVLEGFLAVVVPAGTQ